MDIELRNTSFEKDPETQLDPKNDPKSDVPARTSQRLQYEAQVGVIQKQIGDLESVRLKLGLSARRICQLLLVDPSAWSRWTRPGEEGGAPPHIWRALQWYMTLQEKIPGLTPDYFLGRNAAVETLNLKRELDAKYQALEKGQIAWSEAQNQRVFDLSIALETTKREESELRRQISLLEKKSRSLFIINGALFSVILLFLALKFIFKLF